jgi:uncharacterized protein (TIGR02268 family)
MRLNRVLALGVVLLAFGGAAQAQPDCVHRWHSWEPQRTALFYLKGEPGQPVQSVHVAAEVATNLMFPSEVDPALTKVVGGEGRFEPLMIGGRSVVIVPLRDLAEGESFSLIVTLKDGTAVPFDLRAPRLHDGSDGQVDVHLDQEETTSVRQALQLARSRVEALTSENERHVQEDASVDHALAALLAQGRVDLTPFKETVPTVLHEGGIDLKVITFRPRSQQSDFGKTAVVVRVTNKDPKAAWDLDEVRLLSAVSRDMKPFALRASAQVIAPGQTAAFAVVMDLATFGPDQKDHLVLELWRATPTVPTRQAAIELVMAEEQATPVRTPRRSQTR